MKIFYSDHFVLPLPAGHRFPMQKYALLRQRLVECLPPGVELQVPEAARDDQILLCHHPAYLEKVKTGTLAEKEVRRIGFPWSLRLVERSRRSVGGTLAACRAALEAGFGINLAGGTHHAYPEHGEGFCVFNDAAIAARCLQREGRLRRAVIIDCDVHQGNGTAAIFAGDPGVFTFSIHGLKNYPFHKEHSDLDLHLEDGLQDGAYLDCLRDGLDLALERSRPDLAIYLAGADPFGGDRLGRLALSKSGLRSRDQLVFERCRRMGIPVATLMAGGYARQVEDTVDIHLQTVLAAARMAGALEGPANVS